MRTQWARWAIVAPLSVVLGVALSALHVPAAWILAAIIAAAGSAILHGEELTVDPRLITVAKSFIAIIAALPLVRTPAGELLRYVAPGLLSAGFTVVLAFGGGWLLWRGSLRQARRAGADPRDPAHVVSPKTGVLSLFAGGASVMPLLAKDLGADFRYVTLTQYLRLLSVSIIMPLVVAWAHLSGSSSPSEPEAQPFTWLSALAILVIVVFGGKLGRLLHLPAASVLGPMLLTIIVALLLDPWHSLALPEAARDIAYVSIGWMAGGGLSVAALRSFSHQLPLTLGLIAVLIGGCAGLAWVIAQWMGMDYIDAFLATNPGGLETALALGSETGAVEIVAAMQIVRLITVLFLAGWLPWVLRWLQRVL
ncbi:AbrB family transcriptional regulator [Corynebacterium sp. TAE3-ERU2]|uniref:AbrB family transcriptional regulator n=1 Tax=Corynebacterium sp. TAE3-ERU2 TaxID=2849497 RepID=UPI001C45AB27|nr:AbrB family transcriptional regulator [Corynebacterium sp. TAE3-ERU2]